MRFRKWLSALLALCLFIGILPAAFAEADDEIIIEYVEPEGDAPDDWDTETELEAVEDLVDEVEEFQLEAEEPEPVEEEQFLFEEFEDFAALEMLNAPFALPVPVAGLTIFEGKVVAWTGTDTDIAIPSNQGITAIGDGAFKDCVTLEALSVPAEVTSIGAQAFAGCTALKRLYLFSDPDIASDALDGCSDQLAIYGKAGTKAQTLAEALGLKYYILGAINTIDGVERYVNEDGGLLEGWAQVDGSWHYFDDSGMAKGWKKSDNLWYFFDDEGVMQTGFIVDGGYTYYLRSGGSMATGWACIDGAWHLFRVDGVMYTGWRWVDGSWYYLDENGAMLTGWLDQGGKTYYLTSGGAMALAWRYISGSWYYFNPSGAMATGWKWVDGKYYYMDENGRMQKGWLEEDGKTYYLNPSGDMALGWQEIDGARYFFNPSGAMAIGWKYVDGKFYYLQSDGRMFTGWLQDGGHWYYLDDDGVMVTGKKTIDGVRYEFSSSGALIDDEIFDPYYPQKMTANVRSLGLEVGETFQVEYTVTPSDAVTDVVWSSSNSAVATVDENGLITGVKYGYALISCVSTKNSDAAFQISVSVGSEDVVLTLPAWTTNESGISENLKKIDAIRKCAVEQVDLLRSNGVISSSDASKRKSIINNGFKDLAFPWKTPATQKYWKAANSEGGVKDFQPDRVYFGVPYMSGSGTNRQYNVEKLLKENRYKSTGKGYYLLNQNNLLKGTYCGNDCSCFVDAAIWGTNSSHSADRTTDIAKSNAYRTINDYTAMRPGDLLCKSGAHVVMFLYYTDVARDKIMIIENGGAEAGTNTVHCSIYDLEFYTSRKYKVRRLATLG